MAKGATISLLYAPFITGTKQPDSFVYILSILTI